MDNHILTDRTLVNQTIEFALPTGSINDKILCAAIHIPGGNWTYPTSTGEKPCELPANIGDGIVVTGRRHSDCYLLFFTLSRKPIHNEVQGFLTTSNRFVDRTEAFQIAKESGQLLPHVKLDSDLLTSEMLYLD